MELRRWLLPRHEPRRIDTPTRLCRRRRSLLGPRMHHRTRSPLRILYTVASDVPRFPTRPGRLRPRAHATTACAHRKTRCGRFGHLLWMVFESVYRLSADRGASLCSYELVGLRLMTGVDFVPCLGFVHGRWTGRVDAGGGCDSATGRGQTPPVSFDCCSVHLPGKHTVAHVGPNPTPEGTYLMGLCVLSC